MKTGKLTLRKNSRTVLIVLSAVLALFVAIQLITFEKPRHVPLVYRKGERNSQPVITTDPGSPDLIVRLDLLKKKSPMKSQTKDIFSLYIPPLPPPPPPPSQVVIPPPVVVGPSQEDLARQELRRFRFLGLMMRTGSMEALLARDNERFTAKPGEVVSGTIFLKELREDGVLLRDQPTGVEIKIP